MKTKLLALLCLAALLFSMLCACKPPSGEPQSPSNGDGSGDPQKNMLVIAKTLANEVDTLSSAEELLRGTAAETPSPDRPNKFMRTTTVPSDEFNTENHNTQFEFADSLITRFKRMKDEALTVCRMLGKWVKQGDGPYSAAYRLHYEPNANVVTVEHRSHQSPDENSYQKIRVSYDAEGRLLIDAYLAQYTPTSFVAEKEIHYREGVYFCTTEMEHVGTSRRLLFLDLEQKICSHLALTGSIYYDKDGNIIREEYNPVRPYYCYWDGNYYFSGTGSSSSLYYADGRNIGYLSQENRDIRINLNCFDGWSRYEVEGDQLFFYTDKGMFESLSFTTVNTEDGYGYQIYGAGVPMLCLRAHDALTRERVSAILASLEARFGITLKDSEIAARIIQGVEEYDTVSAKFHYMNGIYGTDITTDTYLLLCDMLATEEFTPASLTALYEDAAIEKSAQTESYEYFEFLDITLSGNATADEAARTLVLDGITATLAPSILLQEGKEYALAFAWASTDGHREVGRIKATYNGEMLTLNGSLSLAWDALPLSYGEHTLLAYVVLDETGGRISEAVTVTATASLTADLSTETVASRLTAGTDKITLTNEVIVEEPEGEEQA